MAGYPYVGQVTDPNAARSLKAAFDQIAALSARIQALEANALLNTGTLNANNQRLTNLATPSQPTDAVTLAFMQQFVLSQVETF